MKKAFEFDDKDYFYHLYINEYGNILGYREEKETSNKIIIFGKTDTQNISLATLKDSFLADDLLTGKLDTKKQIIEGIWELFAYKDGIINFEPGRTDIVLENNNQANNYLLDTNLNNLKNSLPAKKMKTYTKVKRATYN